MSEIEEIAEWRDFSVASDWEEQIAQIEKIFQKFNIGRQLKELNDDKSLLVDKDEIRFGSNTFTIAYYHGNYMAQWTKETEFYPPCMIEMMDTIHDNEKTDSEIQRWFGVSDFIYASIEKVYITSVPQSIINQLLSTLSIAMSHNDIQIPVFVQCYDKAYNIIGQYCSSETIISPSISFNLSTYKLIPPFRPTLHRICQWFREHMNTQQDTKICVTPESKYQWNNNKSKDNTWRPEQIVNDSVLYALQGYCNDYLWGSNENIIRGYLCDLQWEASFDYEKCLPSSLSASSFIMSSIYKYHDNQISDIYFPLVQLTNNIIICLESINNMDTKDIMYIYGQNEYFRTLEKEEQSSKSIKDKSFKFIGHAINRIAGNATVPSLDELNSLFDYILCYNKLNIQDEPTIVPPTTLCLPRAVNPPTYNGIPRGTPPGSLLSQFIMRSSEMMEANPLHSFSILWYNMIRLIRDQYDQLHYLPWLSTPLSAKNTLVSERPPIPDLNSPLLYQKLQMLNICIEERQRKRGNNIEISSPIPNNPLLNTLDIDVLLELRKEEEEEKNGNIYTLSIDNNDIDNDNNNGWHIDSDLDLEEEADNNNKDKNKNIINEENKNNNEENNKNNEENNKNSEENINNGEDNKNNENISSVSSINNNKDIDTTISPVILDTENNKKECNNNNHNVVLEEKVNIQQNNEDEEFDSFDTCSEEENNEDDNNNNTNNNDISSITDYTYNKEDTNEDEIECQVDIHNTIKSTPESSSQTISANSEINESKDNNNNNNNNNNGSEANKNDCVSTPSTPITPNQNIIPNIPLYQQNQYCPPGHEGVYMMSSMTLLHSTTPLYIPLTMDPIIMTEDSLYNQQKLFEEMGDSDDATRKRRVIQWGGLVSDMQAFKAANPGACIEDFIRWHSPNDWKIPEGKTNEEGYLSDRMSDTTNDFYKLWRNSRGIPVEKQSSIIDVKSEGEKVFHYFETMNCQECIYTFLPIYFSSVYYILNSIEHIHDIPELSNILKTLNEQIINLSNIISIVTKEYINNSCYVIPTGKMNKVHSLCVSIRNIISEIEYKASILTSLFVTFNNLSLVQQLYTSFLERTSVNISNSEERQCIINVLKKEHIDDNPDIQYYLLKSTCPLTDSLSISPDSIIPVGHRLRIKISSDTVKVSENISTSDVLLDL
ncbi:hypothetical protein WA158_003432 [Blastocystis sp. Blastoise]